MRKNIYLTSTERESNLYKNEKGLFYLISYFAWNPKTTNRESQFIYITNNEKLKIGDWVLNSGDYDKDIVFKVDEGFFDTGLEASKIIVTNDPTLIKDGVQEISEEFLKQFIISPVDYVEVEEFNAYGVDNWKYLVSFPQKETKVWLKPGDKEDIINSIAVKDNESRLRIDVYEYENFIVSLGKEEVDIQEISFTIDEMKNIYEFLKQYYEE